MRFPSGPKVLLTWCLIFLLVPTAPRADSFTSAEVVEATTAVDCLDWKIVGVCLKLKCGIFGCRIKARPWVEHRIPDLVVSAYNEPGENPWVEGRPCTERRSQRPLTPPPGPPWGFPSAGATARPRRPGGPLKRVPSPDSNLRFKEISIIGNPATLAFRQWLDRRGRARGLHHQRHPHGALLLQRGGCRQLAYRNHRAALSGHLGSGNADHRPVPGPHVGHGASPPGPRAAVPRRPRRRRGRAARRRCRHPGRPAAPLSPRAGHIGEQRENRPLADGPPDAARNSATRSARTGTITRAGRTSTDRGRAATAGSTGRSMIAARDPEGPLQRYGFDRG